MRNTFQLSQYLLTSLYFSLGLVSLYSQNCTLSGGMSYNQAAVESCLGAGACPCTITITGGIVDVVGEWDFESRGNISIIIEAGASLRFGTGDLLTLSAGSSISLEDGMPDGMLTSDGSLQDDDIVIVKGSQQIEVIQLNDFDSDNPFLPIVLQYFEGGVHNQTIGLTWQTLTELNNAKFIIETSPLGEVFQPLGEVAGAGTTTEPQNYSFTHHTPSAGINYYRLKQVDFDGTFEYSKVIAIEAAGSQDIFAFPNPARGKITLQYDQSKGAGNIQLLDALGRRINANIAGYAGNYEVVLPESLARGTYWLKVERTGKVQTLPVVKE